MNTLLKQKSLYLKTLLSRPFKLILVSIIVISGLIGIISISPPVSAAPNNIPIGCPGTLISGPATTEQRAVCDNIPIGCPGSTRQGPPSPGFDKSTCPYGDGTDDSTNPPPSTDTSCTSAEQCAPRKEVTADCNKKDEELTRENCQIVDYLVILTNILSAMVGIVVIIVIIIGGIQYSASAGDPQAAAAAKKRISNALLALVAFGLMYGFLQWIIPGGLF